MQKLNVRQKLLRVLYPVLLRTTRLFRKEDTVLKNENRIPPPRSLYELSITLNNGSDLPLSSLMGKKVLFVNTASDCGYTAQYAELQKLYERTKDNLAIIGFPANDFKEQEKGNDVEIARFCELNFGVKFPLAKKSIVVKGDQQNSVFKWLTHLELNGWNDQAPAWNFSKYLVDGNGILTHCFKPSVSPLSDTVIDAVDKY